MCGGSGKFIGGATQLVEMQETGTLRKAVQID